MESKPTIITNLCLIRKGDTILLGMKKRGFGAGRWNGYGGKVDKGETIEECLVREVKEESGLVISNYRQVGFLRFHNVDLIVDMAIFETFDFDGDPVETEEMNPRWFSVKNLPFIEMWPPDPLWYPLYLQGKYFEGEVFFDENHKILNHSIHEVLELSFKLSTELK